MNFPKVGILIHGPLYNEYCVDLIIEKYYPFRHSCVFTTWSNQPEELITKLKKNFKVIVKDQPLYTGNHNCNLQIQAVKNGIDELSDFTNILRIRSDIIPNNVDKFISTLCQVSLDRIVFLCWHNRYDAHYFADFFNFSQTYKMKKFWDVLQEEGHEHSNMFTEQYLCYKDTGLKFPKYQDISNRYTFCFKELYQNNVELNWIKPGRDWGDHVKRCMTLISDEILHDYH